MEKIATILALFMATIGFSQTAIKKSSIDSGGASETTGNITLIYTIGEVAVQEQTNGNIHISEGFISVDSHQSLGIDDGFNPLQNVNVFPNPTSEFLVVNLEKLGDYELFLFDLNGQKLASYPLINQKDLQIDFQAYSVGTYFLVIKNKDQNSSFKIIKQ